MSAAESTVKFAIFDAILSQWHRKNETDFVNEVRNAIFDKIFEPHLRWAVEEHLQSLKSTSNDKEINHYQKGQ